MKMKTKPCNRNKEVTGHNSMSYDDKHRSAPVSLRPIHDAIQKVPKIAVTNSFNPFSERRPDYKRINELRRVGSRLARPQIVRYLAV
jgi:hypothetical protein